MKESRCVESIHSPFSQSGAFFLSLTPFSFWPHSETLSHCAMGAMLRFACSCCKTRRSVSPGQISHLFAGMSSPVSGLLCSDTQRGWAVLHATCRRCRRPGSEMKGQEHKRGAEGELACAEGCRILGILFFLVFPHHSPTTGTSSTNDSSDLLILHE